MTGVAECGGSCLLTILPSPVACRTQNLVGCSECPMAVLIPVVVVEVVVVGGVVVVVVVVVGVKGEFVVDAG